MGEKSKELLEQQMALLSERSKNENTVEDLAMLSRAMVEIAEVLNRTNAQAH